MTQDSCVGHAPLRLYQKTLPCEIDCPHRAAVSVLPVQKCCDQHVWRVRGKPHCGASGRPTAAMGRSRRRRDHRSKGAKRTDGGATRHVQLRAEAVMRSSPCMSRLDRHGGRSSIPSRIASSTDWPWSPAKAGRNGWALVNPIQSNSSPNTARKYH